MGLYERLCGTEEPKLPIHQFMAALGEHDRGKMTRDQVVFAFSLSAAEQVELDTLIGKILNPPEVYNLGNYTLLTNVGSAYDAIQPAKGLGILYIETAGVCPPQKLVIGIGPEIRLRIIRT